MKLKGLAEALEALDTLDGNLNEKIDSIEWDGQHDNRDQQKDEMFNEGLGIVLAAREALEEIKELRLEDF